MMPRFVKPIKAQPRLITAIVLGALLPCVLPGRQSTRLLAAWDCSTGLYLVLALAMMARSNIDRIRARAALQDEGQIVILALTTITALVSLAGVMMELALAKTLKTHDGWQHIAACRNHCIFIMDIFTYHICSALCA